MVPMFEHLPGASALVYSISETAKLNNLRPYYYFSHILTELPKYCDEKRKYRSGKTGSADALGRGTSRGMSETTPLIKAALNLKVGAGFDVYDGFRSGIPVFILPESWFLTAVLPQLSVSSCLWISQFCLKQPLTAPSIHCSLYHF